LTIGKWDQLAHSNKTMVAGRFFTFYNYAGAETNGNKAWIFNIFTAGNVI
jgi:hypothetical protein